MNHIQKLCFEYGVNSTMYFGVLYYVRDRKEKTEAGK
jgi:hypothetical protein